MDLKKKNIQITAGIIILFYLLFFPAPTAEMAVRKDLFFEFHPVKAFSNSVHEGGIKNDPRYGNMYLVDGIDLSFIYVKKNALGWKVTSRGTGP